MAGLVSIESDQKALDALVLMEGQGLSELPVLEGGQVVGNLSDITLAWEMHNGAYLGDKTVREIMDPPLAQVDLGMDVHDVYRLLKGGQPGLIVTHDGLPVGFVNRLDLMGYWRRETFGNGGGI